MPLTIRRRLVDRVRQLRKIAYFGCAGLVLLAVAVVFLSLSAPASSVEIASGSTFFDAARSYRTAEEMEYYPNRAQGSEEAAGVVNWLVDRLSTLGLSKENITKDEFKASLGNKTVTFRNVAVVLPGSSKETIIVTAPRDTPSIVKVNRLSYASGTAMLVELAQVFSSRPHHKTIVFLSTEASRNGGLSVRRFLDSYPSAANVTTILSIDGLGKEESDTIKADVAGSENTTPGWYLQLTSHVLNKAGLRLKVPGIMSQAADQALSLSDGDQAAGLNRGIASISLYDNTPANPTTAGLATQGAALETLVLSLDNASELTGSQDTALLLSSGRFLTKRSIGFLAALMVLPTVAALLIWLFASRAKFQTTRRHLRNLASFAIPFAWIFLLAYILSRFGLIPKYAFAPPAASGPATHPRLLPIVILIILGGAGFVASRHYLGYLRPREARATTEMSRLAVGFFGLLLGLLFILIRSPFLILPCLVIAWAWPLATCFAEPVRTGAVWRPHFSWNGPLLLLGLVAPVLLYFYIAAQGVNWATVWWYLLVQAVSGAYGFWGIASFIMIAASFLTMLGAKRMRVVPIETLEVTDELSLLEPPIPWSRRRERGSSRPPLSPWG